MGEFEALGGWRGWSVINTVLKYDILKKILNFKNSLSNMQVVQLNIMLYSMISSYLLMTIFEKMREWLNPF